MTIALVSCPRSSPPFAADAGDQQATQNIRTRRAMPPIVLYSEMRYPNDIIEKDVYGKDIAVRWRDVEDIA